MSTIAVLAIRKNSSFYGSCLSGDFYCNIQLILNVILPEFSNINGLRENNQMASAGRSIEKYAIIQS
jgi:hypothetical protein